MVKCKCGKEHDGSFGSGMFCSRSCANSKVVGGSLKKLSCFQCGEEFEIGLRAPIKSYCPKCRIDRKHKRTCRICGQLECPRKDICSKHQVFSSLEKYFGFDISLLGSLEALKEFDRVRNLIEEDYKDLSLLQMEEKYSYCYGGIQRLMQSLGLKRRGHSEGALKAFRDGKCVKGPDFNPQFHSGWHETWDGRKVFLRSSYEFEVAKKLDIEKRNYQVESLRILYWDSQKNIQRTAIPDFFLPKENLIIEVKALKSIYFDEINMEDKKKAYLNHGYSFDLVCW